MWITSQPCSKVRPKTESRKDGEIDPKFWEILLSADKKDYERICAEYGVTDFRWTLKKLNEMKREREQEQAEVRFWFVFCFVFLDTFSTWNDIVIIFLLTVHQEHFQPQTHWCESWWICFFWTWSQPSRCQQQNFHLQGKLTGYYNTSELRFAEDLVCKLLLCPSGWRDDSIFSRSWNGYETRPESSWQEIHLHN